MNGQHYFTAVGNINGHWIFLKKLCCLLTLVLNTLNITENFYNACKIMIYVVTKFQFRDMLRIY